MVAVVEVRDREEEDLGKRHTNGGGGVYLHFYDI